MRIAREEIFGPVLSIIAYRDTEDAIANDTPYARAYIAASDADRTGAAASRIEGGVLVNTLTHEPAAPFGGFKQSGIGREYGTFGLEAFLEPKSPLGTLVTGSGSRQ
jgi:aldehyde dehydrogenase (NAD+)